jgi:ADP-ribose pyrophosphatase
MTRRVEIIEVQTGYQGFFELRRYRLRHTLYAGDLGPELTQERVERMRAVAILLYDPARDRVVLVEQFRIGALEQGEGAWLLEVAGGIHDPHLTQEQVARREAQEEAGCEVLDLIPIQELWVSPGTANERVMLYCGRVDSEGAGGLYGLAHEGEDCRVVVLDMADARAALEQGRINTAITAVALQWLLLHRDVVQSLWTRTAPDRATSG